MRRDVLRVLGPAGAHLGSIPTDPAEPGELAAALAGVAHVAGASGRALLAIDDVHFGDADLRLLLGSVSRSSAPLCAVVSLTGTSVDASELVDEIGAPDADCVVMNGLDESAVRQIVLDRRADASPQLIDELCQRSGGNPLFLVTMLESDPHFGGLELPSSIVDGVSRRLAALPDRERAICEAMAAVGRTCPFDLVERLVAVAEADILAGLRRLQDLRLVSERPADHFWFRSPMMAAVAAANTLDRQRRRLHSTVLEVLEESDDPDPATILSHAVAIGDTDRAVSAARAASTAALSSGTPARAARLANEGLGIAADDVALLLAAAEAEFRCSDLEATERHATAALAAQYASVAQRAAAWRTLARARWTVGNGAGRDEALSNAAALLPLLENGSDRALIYLAQAESAMIADDVSRTMDAVTAARAQISTDDEAPSWITVALDVIEGSVLACRTDSLSAKGISILEGALPAALRAGDVTTAGRVLNNLIHATVHRRSLGSTEALVDQLETLASCDERVRAVVRTWRALLGELRGFEDTVVAYAQPPTMPTDARDLAVCIIGAGLLLDQARLDEAAPVLAAASSLATLRTDPEHVWWARSLSLEQRILAGEQIASTVVTHLEGEVHPTLEAADRVARLAVAAAGRWPGTAEPLATAMARWLDPVAQAGWALHLQALTFVANGEHELAIAKATASATDEYPRAAASRAGAWLLAAQSCAAIGDKVRGRECAQAALTVVERWPGTTHDEAVSVLRKLGGRPRAKRSSGLSPREQEVAKLIAVGLANAEIGSRLGMSARTVGVHVTHILTKLGASNRTEIATYAVRNGIVE